MNISIDALRKYVEKIAKIVLDDETNKPVVVGTVMSSLPGCYEVQLVNGNQTSLVRAQSLYSDKVFAVNDSVYLVKAESNRGDNYETNYFIVGLVTTIEQNFANLTEWERFLGDGQKIYPKLNENTVEISFDTNIDDDPDTKEINEGNNFTNFLNAAGANGVISFSADVSTNISDPGNFGLIFEFTFDDKPIREEEFPGTTFVGQPWSLKNVTQKKIFDLGTQNNLKSITIKKTDPTAGTFDISNISLESGTFLDLVNDFKVTLENVNGKNYLNKSADNGVVQIKANVNYGNQKLDTKALKYYWFVKRESATHINSLGGNDWECLNDFSYAQYIDKNGIQTKQDVLIYKTDDNILEIDYKSANADDNDNNYKNWLPHYENEIKCVVGYQLANATSSPIKVYNFNKESYNITIEKISGESPILYKDEYIVLEAKYTSKTVNPTAISTFKWYKKGNPNPLTYKDEKGVDQLYISSIINIYGQNSNKSNTENDYVMKDELEEFYCIAYLGENAINTESETNSIIISSKTTLATQLIEQSNFKYWIDTKSNIRFVSKTKIEEIKEDNTTGGTTFEDSYIYYTTESDVEGINPGISKLNELKEKNEIFEEYITGEYYLYYTEQKIVVDENKNNVYRYNDYSYPKILRYVYVNKENKTVTDLILDGAIEKLNTFNELTDGGSAQGIEYDDGDLYINASFIRSGHLEVGNGEKTVFSADLESGDVIIKTDSFQLIPIVKEEDKQYDLVINTIPLKLQKDTNNNYNLTIDTNQFKIIDNNLTIDTESFKFNTNEYQNKLVINGNASIAGFQVNSDGFVTPNGPDDWISSNIGVLIKKEGMVFNMGEPTTNISNYSSRITFSKDSFLSTIPIRVIPDIGLIYSERIGEKNDGHNTGIFRIVSEYNNKLELGSHTDSSFSSKDWGGNDAYITMEPEKLYIGFKEIRDLTNNKIILGTFFISEQEGYATIVIDRTGMYVKYLNGYWGDKYIASF